MTNTIPNSESMTQEQAITFLYQRNEQLTKQVEELQKQHYAVNQSSKPAGLRPPKPDVFKGDSVDLFIFTIEKSFDYYQVHEEQKVSIAVTYFRESALRWYRYIEGQSGGMQYSWNQFKTMMLHYFKASNTETVVRNKLNSLRQQTSVSKYNDLFNNLIIELPQMDERTKIDMYCRGLKPNVHLHVSLANPSKLGDAQTLAMNVDNIFGATMFKKKNSPIQSALLRCR